MSDISGLKLGWAEDWYENGTDARLIVNKPVPFSVASPSSILAGWSPNKDNDRRPERAAVWPEKAYLVPIFYIEARGELVEAFYNSIRRFIGPLPTFDQLPAGAARSAGQLSNTRLWFRSRPSIINHSTEPLRYKHSEPVLVSVQASKVAGAWQFVGADIMFGFEEDIECVSGITIAEAIQLIRSVPPDGLGKVKVTLHLPDKRTGASIEAYTTARELFDRYEIPFPPAPYCRYRKFAGMAPLRERYEEQDEYSLIGGAR